ncbi:MAG: electron transfer flavoprotein subunit alpha/FixB family protein [Bacteroidia bacterium]|nr:MAG: electron transfer flavoprotein subunit alpha/FixB family protein [Bacteroidia bacterium]
MIKILLITSALDNKFNDKLFNLLGASKKLFSQCNVPYGDIPHGDVPYCDVLVVGHNIAKCCAEIATYAGVFEVLMLDDIIYADLIIESMYKGIAGIIRNYSHVLIIDDSFGKSLLPKIAGFLELAQLSSVVGIISANVFQRYIYAGNILVDVELYEPIKLLPIRATAFLPYAVKDKTTGVIKAIMIAMEDSEHKVILLKKRQQSEEINLSNAKVVVSGGRALLSKENFEQLIIALAHKYKGAYGATRQAVELGLADNSSQVGQTGQIIAPEVYVAFGISGAVQHIVGMKDSKIVIAINTDHSAPIFEYADYGLIEDLFEVIPKLLTQ